MPTLAEIASGITPIIDTFRAGALGKERESVLSRYLPNAQRYFPQEAVKRVRKNLVERLKTGKRTLGYLQAPYGHGKTATAIYLWSEAQAENICAVPPFQFTSLDDIVVAVSGWLGESFHDRNAAFVPKLNELVGKYRTQTVDEHAEQVAKRYKLDLDVARRIVAGEIADKVAIGRAAHLADFLVAAAHLAVEAGFQSLCIFCDEMQIFMDSGDTRENVEDFRQLVLALRAETAPLGLMFVIHDRTGMLLEEQAGDAMQRLRDEGVGLNLGEFKEETFPARLLAHLCKMAGEPIESVVDAATLDALGQISLRADLSNGPRTVAAALRAIGRYRAETGKTYRIWDLVRDYEQGSIVFDGVGRSLAGALARILSDSIVRSDKRFGDVVRFLCVFPEGASESHLKHYALLIPLTELAQERGLLGTVIYSPRSLHWALKDLQLNPQSGDRISEMVRHFLDNFWYRQTPAAKISTAHQAFAKLLLPELFARRERGDAGRKFSGHIPFGEAWGFRPPGEVLLSGSFEGTTSRFPERRVAIAIASNADVLNAYRPSDADTHLYFTFRLDMLAEKTPHRLETANSDPRLAFTLNLNVGLGDDYPPEMAVLKDTIVPRQCNACILLNLVHYVVETILKMPLPEADKEQIKEYLLRSPLRRIEQMLLPAKDQVLDGELPESPKKQLEAVGITPRGRGRQMMEALFEDKLSECYPNYKPLLSGAESVADLDRYERLLKEGGLGLAVKRGQKPVQLATTDILAKMGASSASAYDALASRLKRLLLLVEGNTVTMERVRHVDVTFSEHPLEILLRSEIETHGLPFTVRRGGRDVQTKQIEKNILTRLAVRKGYSKNECDTALKLGEWRQWLEANNDRILLAVPGDDPEVIRREMDDLCGQVQAFTSLEASASIEFGGRLDLLSRRLEQASPEGLSEIGLELRLLRERLRERLQSIARSLGADAQRLRGGASDGMRRLPLADFAQPVTLPGSVGGILESFRKKLLRHLDLQKTEMERVGTQAATLCQMVTEAAVCEVPDLLRHKEALTRLEQAQEKTQKQAVAASSAFRHLQQWLTLGATAERLGGEIDGRDAELTRRLSDWIDGVVEASRVPPAEAITFLVRHTEFEPALSAMAAEFKGREQKRRDRYESFVSRVASLFTGASLTPPRSVPFDGQNEALSYDSYNNEAAHHLRAGLERLLPGFAELAARAVFLHEFRSRNVSELTKRITAARTSVDQALAQANSEQVAAYRDGSGKLPALCGTFQTAMTERNLLSEALSALETPDAPGAGLQSEVFLALKNTSGKTDSVTLGEMFRTMRRSQSVTASELFTALEALYMQGNAEIIIKERSRS